MRWKKPASLSFRDDVRGLEGLIQVNARNAETEDARLTRSILKEGTITVEGNGDRAAFPKAASRDAAFGTV